MATLPSAEDTARLILDALVEESIRAGESMPFGAFRDIATKHGVDARDLSAGLEFGVAQGWLETNDRGFVTLTEAGFKAAKSTHKEVLHDLADRAQQVAAQIQQADRTTVDQFQRAVGDLGAPRDPALENVERAIGQLVHAIDAYLQSG